MVSRQLGGRRWGVGRGRQMGGVWVVRWVGGWADDGDIGRVGAWVMRGAGTFDRKVLLGGQPLPGSLLGPHLWVKSLICPEDSGW